jgi:hypothetical protein
MRFKKELIIVFIAIVFGLLTILSVQLIFAISYNEYNIVINFLAKFFITLMVVFYLPYYLYNLSKADYYLRGTSGDVLEISYLIIVSLWIYLIARFSYSFFINWKERKFKIFKDYFNIIIKNKFKILFLIIILFILILGSNLHSKSIVEENKKLREEIKKEKRISQIPEIKEKESLFKDKYIGLSKKDFYLELIIDPIELSGFRKIANHRFEPLTLYKDDIDIEDLHYAQFYNESDEALVNFKENIYPSNQWFIYASGGWMYEFKFNKDDIVENVFVTNAKYLK